MPTDYPTVLARLQDEADALDAIGAVVDMAAETAIFEQAEVAWAAADALHKKRTRRWNFLSGIQGRRAAVQQEIDLLTELLG